VKTEIISMPTDGQSLDGLFYEPDGPPKKGAILLFHGNTMNFYVGAPRFLPPVLVPMGYACLAFNRRGHDVLSTCDSRNLVGGAYQTIEQSIADNRYAARWLAQKGYSDPIVIGHSNGGMLSVRHVVEHPETRGHILLSAHRGGPDLLHMTSQSGLFAGERYDEFKQQAKRMVDMGQGSELMLLPGWYNVMTADTFLDADVNMPDMLEWAPQITCPALFVRGDEEPASIYPAEEFQKRTKGACEVEIIKNCGHFYVGCEDKVTDVVAKWLVKTFGS
jgi:pimeloyl-ACP methyl ester carboxylesterase